MRERTQNLDPNAAGNHVSAQYLKASLYWRAKALEDDPTVALFFGRLDYLPGAGPWGERFYIGRRHVTDSQGEPLVVDWRADVSVPFYRASKATPMGVRLRRRFGYQHGELTGYEDEHVSDPAEAAQTSHILEEEIERPRVGPMRDIVATIQPEQDEIVRSDIAGTVVVQGAPGTGKTAVGLHRAAYLLYTHRDQLRRQGVLVIGPNDSFLRYIGDVLPALGEIEARQTTVAELLGKTLSRGPGSSPGKQSRGTDPADVATLKGDARMAEVLRRAVWSHISPPTEGLIVPRGSRRFRVPAYEVTELLEGIRNRGVRYGAGRAMLPQRLAHAILLRMEADGDSPDDRVQNAVARSRPVKVYADALWPAVDPAKLLLRLLTEPEFLASHASDVLTEEEQALLIWPKPPRSAGSARWSLADAALIDELTDLIDRMPSLGHVVLDEAQDLSPMQLRAVGRRCSTGSATVLGDLAQATTPWAVRDWAAAMEQLGKPDAHLEELTLGFRVPADVIEYAARLLPAIAPTLAPPTSVRRTRGDLVISRVSDGVVAAAVAAVRTALDRPGSVGLIAADTQLKGLRVGLEQAGIDYSVLGDEDDVDARLDVVPASLAKGLEFDHVVLVEPSAIVAAEADEPTGLRRLYVCLTRAVTSLAILHGEPLPSRLAG
jgi:DNA helicase IV